MPIPRPEHPRPQFVRSHWQNLNGLWQFEMDNARSGEARGLQAEGIPLSGSIIVPFCPESKLSGVGHTDFILGAWYKRSLTISHLKDLVLLHFGAVDYRCRIYVNGKLAGEHAGGYSSFCFDITTFLQVGENELCVYVEDDSRDWMIPSGKQSREYGSYGCYYTRTTGIWQTVWVEYVPLIHIDNVVYHPNVTDGSITVQVQLTGCADFSCEISYEGTPMGSYSCKQASGQLTFTVPLAERHLWEPGAGRLYDVQLTFGQDCVGSYFGLRQVHLDGYKFLINGKSVFQRLVLDQGFYPDGIYTAPSDEALVRDIQMAIDLGFNGARPHEKVFEERYLYHADRMGYLLWGEFGDWGLDSSRPESIYSVLPQWMEVVQRDRNHPSIIGWCPRNETWDIQGRKQFEPSISLVYDATKSLDPSRPCIDTSGHFHVKTDIFDVHNYNQDPTSFKEQYDKLMTDGTLYEVYDPPESHHKRYEFRQHYPGDLPVFVSEYGGIRWAAGENDPEKKASWGYGKDVQDEEAFYQRYQGLADALLDNDRMFGLCYTQLTDVEQEQNGLYTYDRKPKFNTERLRKIMDRKAAIED